MIVKIYCIHDSKANAYLQPFFNQTNGTAVRAFSEAVNDSQTNFNKYPSDFTLFEIGEFDDATGTVSKKSIFTNLGTALDYKKQLDLPNSRQMPLPIEAGASQ